MPLIFQPKELINGNSLIAAKQLPQISHFLVVLVDPPKAKKPWSYLRQVRESFLVW